MYFTYRDGLIELVGSFKANLLQISLLAITVVINVWEDIHRQKKFKPNKQV